MSKNENYCEKTIPTTLGLFFEWYIGWTYRHGWLQPSDISETMLDRCLGDAVYGCFEDGHDWDDFFGVRRGMFCEDASRVAEFIREHFNDRIYLRQYWYGASGFVRFVLDNEDFDIQCASEFGSYEYDVDEFGLNYKK